MMTAFFDKVHLLNSRLYSVENKIQLAKENNNGRWGSCSQLEVRSYAEEARVSGSSLLT